MCFVSGSDWSMYFGSESDKLANSFANIDFHDCGEFDSNEVCKVFRLAFLALHTEQIINLPQQLCADGRLILPLLPFDNLIDSGRLVMHPLIPCFLLNCVMEYTDRN